MGRWSKASFFVLFGVASSWLGACAVQSSDGPPLGADASGSAGSGASAGDSMGGTASAGTATGGGGTSSGGSAPLGSSGSPTVIGGAGAGSTAAGSGGGGAGGLGGTGGGGSGGAAGAGGSAGEGGNDLCPDDADKTAPGKCGCGVPDTDSVVGASCVPLQNSLVHRYSFEGDAKDSVGVAHGTLMGGATISGGALTLAGAQSGQYLDLPNALVSSLTDATIEAYVTWTGAADGDWQRIFDFGSSDMAEGTPGTGAKYLFLSARTFRACYTSATPKSEIFTDSSTPFPSTAAQVAVVVNSSAKTLSLYLDGTAVGMTTLNLPLSAINDVNNWLGRSQYAGDDYFGGQISEFRIYNAALTGPQLKTSKKMGENTTYLKKQ